MHMCIYIYIYTTKRSTYITSVSHALDYSQRSSSLWLLVSANILIPVLCMLIKRSKFIRIENKSFTIYGKHEDSRITSHPTSKKIIISLSRYRVYSLWLQKPATWCVVHFLRNTALTPSLIIITDSECVKRRRICNMCQLSTHQAHRKDTLPGMYPSEGKPRTNKVDGHIFCNEFAWAPSGSSHYYIYVEKSEKTR